MKEDARRGVARLSSEVLGFGLTIAVSTFLFGYLGSLAGSKLGAKEVFTLFGGLVGAAAGFYSLYLHVVVRPREAQQKEEESE